MTKEEFNKLEILKQVEYTNKLLKEGQTLRKISGDLSISKTTIRDRSKKIGYIYNPATKQYIKDNNIKIQLRQNITSAHYGTPKERITGLESVIQNNINSKREVNIIKKENNVSIDTQEVVKLKTALAEVQELLEMKDQLKELIQDHNRSKSIVNVIEPQELKVDKDRFEGSLKGRLIKVYDNVNNEWIKFCKNNDQFKMQDLYSIALLEFIEKYKK